MKKKRANKEHRELLKLRKAIKAEKRFWKHLLFCTNCELRSVIARFTCPEALALRADYNEVLDSLKIDLDRSKKKGKKNVTEDASECSRIDS